MQNIGLVIKKLREERSMTQLSLALKAGIDNSLISRIESGDTSGSIKSLSSIADALGVSIGDLLNNQQS